MDGESCELHQGDLRELDAARAAVADCTHVIHLAAIVGGIANFHKLPHTLLEVNNGLYNAVFRAALEEPVERLVYVSSSMVFENATEFPTTEGHVHELPGPSIRLRLLEARRRGLLPRAPRRARPPVHDLPALQRLRARRAAGRRAGDRARRAGPDSQGAVGPAPARDLRVGRPDPHAHARGRHRGRHRHGHGESRRARTRTSTSRRPTSAPLPRSPRSSGRRAVGIRRSSS